MKQLWNIMLLFIIPILFAYQVNENYDNRINYDCVYVSRDTLFSIDKSFKNEITISLLKFNKDNTVRTSVSYSYSQGEDDKLHSSFQKYLNSFSSYYFEIDKKSNLKIRCKFKYPKRQAIDFATPKANTINQSFTIVGDTLIRKGKSNQIFKKIYILNKSLILNHSELKHKNACQ